MVSKDPVRKEGAALKLEGREWEALSASEFLVKLQRQQLIGGMESATYLKNAPEAQSQLL